MIYQDILLLLFRFAVVTLSLSSQTPQLPDPSQTSKVINCSFVSLGNISHWKIFIICFMALQYLYVSFDPT